MAISTTRAARRLFPVLISAAGLVASADAQRFNVDFDSPFSGLPVTPATYAAAGTAGVWNQIDGSTGNAFNLVDKNGAPTGVTMTLSSQLNLTLFFDNTSIVGDDADLLEDIVYGGSSETITFTGLANGSYSVYTYAIAPDNKTGLITDVNVLESTDGVQAVGGSLWLGSHQQGVSYALHTAIVTSGTLTLSVAINTGDLSVNGIQLEAGSGPGVAYCFGDGTGAVCPCGNNNDGSNGDAGCANSVNAGGANLTGTGLASVTSDTVMLTATGLQPNQPGLFYRGDNAPNGGNGLLFGDGLRCAGGNIVRLGVVVADGAGVASSASAMGAGLVGGDVRRYQYWYRNPAGSPCGSAFNLTNGYEINWGS